MTEPARDAFLLVSYGAPERREEVLPFLQRIFHGKEVSAERIQLAAEKYHRFAEQTGQYSPLNAECQKLLQVLPVGIKQYWGNLFWKPLLADTVKQMVQDGVKNAVYFTTSAFDSYTANRRYDEALERTVKESGADLTLRKLLSSQNPMRQHPLFIKAQANTLLEATAWATLDSPSGETPLTLFSAHSIPKQDAAMSNYVGQLQETCQKVAAACGITDWELVFQSRSGSPSHWIGPDIQERIGQIAIENKREKKYAAVVVSPIGFFLENMETLNDLDGEVGCLCKELGLNFRRAKTVGTSPEIGQMIAEGV
jgi:ferrochelatase